MALSKLSHMSVSGQTIYRKMIIERVDDKLRDNQAEADGNVRLGDAVVDIDLDADFVRIEDHRSTQAAAELGEIGAQMDVARIRRSQMLLDRSNRHHPSMGELQVRTAFVGVHPSRTLQKNAGDDLKAVGDAVLDFLQKDGLFGQQVVLLLFGKPCVGDIEDRQQQPFFVEIALN